MEQLKNIKQCLVSSVQTQLGDLKKTDAKELGEVIDMIKDLEEAMYYCSIIEAMEKSQSEKKDSQAQNNIAYFMEPDRMMYRGENNGSNNNSSSNNNSTSRNYTPYMEYAPYMMRDEGWRNGRSDYSRRMYMEKKSNNSDDNTSMKELEHYIQDLGDDLTDMVKHSNQEEKQVLSTKLQQLATKINNTK